MPAAPSVDLPQAASSANHSPPNVESWTTRRVLVLALISAWVLGVLALLARWVFGWWLLGRLRREALPIGDEVLATCQAEVLCKRSVTLATHPRVGTPLSAGPWPAMVLVPPGWTALPAAARRACLLHELAHLARRDDWTVPALELVRAFFFFHPLVHWLLARLERERELLCDEAVLARGVEAHDYARLLLDYARRPARLAASLPALRIGRPRTVRVRIDHILEENMNAMKRPLPRSRALALVAVVLAGALGLGSLRVRGVGAPAAMADEPRANAAALPKEDEAPAQAKPVLRYADKTLLEWRTTLATDLSPQVRAEAIKALGAFGANGHATEAIRDIVQVIRKLPVDYRSVRAEFRDDQKVLDAASEAVRRMGLDAAPALVDELKKGNPNSRSFVAMVFGSEPFRQDLDRVTPALVVALRDENASVRYQALGSIQVRRVRHVKGLGQGLAASLQDRDQSIRWSAVERLAECGPDVPEAIAALLLALKNDDPGTRRLAAGKLGSLKPPGSEVVPALVEALQDQDRNVRVSAASALAEIRRDAKVAVPALLKLIGTWSQDSEGFIHQALGAYGAEAKEAVPAMIQFLKERPPEQAWSVLRALGEMGPAAREAVPVLRDLLIKLKVEDLDYRREIVKAMQKIEK
jgi:beta-lactamase regulating signal transducer with metallopeptidase domain